MYLTGATKTILLKIITIIIKLCVYGKPNNKCNKKKEKYR